MDLNPFCPGSKRPQSFLRSHAYEYTVEIAAEMIQSTSTSSDSLYFV